MMTNADTIDQVDTMEPVALSPRKRRVLVVEDDVRLLMSVRDILDLEGYDVRTAKNGVEALEVLQSDLSFSPDVIVSDIMMPKMDGYEFLKHVRKEDRWVQVPFIFLTAKSEPDDIHKGQILGADIYLTKPFDAKSLLVSVEASLRRQEDIRRVKEDELMGQKRKILTILNHEFRTPLTLVVAYAEMLKEFEPGKSSHEELMSFLNGLNSGADRLRRLVENFIVLVELDSDEAEKTIAWRKRPVENLQYMLDDAVRQIAFPTQRPREFQVELVEDLPTPNLDVQYMTIAIRELLDNAAKFSEDGDTILLKVFAEGEEVVFKVIDNGRGIPEKELENIWKPFYQINREALEDQGAGSGLAIVNGIVELHGGRCEVVSESGSGSTFTIRLPLQP
jgi:signal transduction histidine kinase